MSTGLTMPPPASTGRAGSPPGASAPSGSGVRGLSGAPARAIPVAAAAAAGSVPGMPVGCTSRSSMAWRSRAAWRSAGDAAAAAPSFALFAAGAARAARRNRMSIGRSPASPAGPRAPATTSAAIAPTCSSTEMASGQALRRALACCGVESSNIAASVRREHSAPPDAHLPHFEDNGEVEEHLDRAAVQQGGGELPLADGLDRLFVEPEPQPLPELDVDDVAAFVDDGPQHHDALQVGLARRLGVARLDLGARDDLRPDDRAADGQHDVVAVAMAGTAAR